MMKYLLVISGLLLTFTMSAQTANFWTKKNDYPGLKRERAVAFTIDEVAYVGTGVDTAEQVRQDFWSYDAYNDSWTQIADIPGARRNAVAFAINGFGYVGTGMNHVDANIGSPVKSFYKYNPSNNTWSPIPDFPASNNVGIYFGTGFSIDSKGYVCCGKFGPNNYSSQLWSFDPATNQWTQLPNFPGGVRYQLSSFVIGSKAYVGLGTDQDMYRKDIWEFKASTNQWIARNDFPGSERASATTFNIGDRGFVCMGTNGGLLDDLWEYKPQFDEWEVRANYGGSRRKNAVGFTISGKGYVGTGKGNSGKKQSFHMYTPLEFVSLDELSSTVKLFPNPSNGMLTIKGLNESTYFTVQSIDGKQVYQSILGDESTDLYSLSAGTYIVAVWNAKNELISKMKWQKI